jgi:hypothetical protein
MLTGGHAGKSDTEDEDEGRSKQDTRTDEPR